MAAQNNLYRKKGGLTKVGEAKLIERLIEEIRFQPRELKRIIAIYKKYLKDTWYMDISAFSEFLHNSFGFNEDFLINRIFQAADTNRDNRVDMEEFLRMVGVMLRGSREEKIDFCFRCYDLSDHNELTREDVTTLLVEGITESPYKEVNPDIVRDLSDMIFVKMDEDRDSVISFDEYKRACMKDWLLTEAFGQCMPDHRYRAAFLIIVESEQEIVEDDIEVDDSD